MARRPPHLRWIYVKDHPRPFLALAAVTVLGLSAVAVFLSDPARGLILGAMPVAFGVAAWALTNRAGYPDRDPTSLPHERHDPGGADQLIAETNAEPPEPAWDPFAGQRKTVTDAPADPFEQSPDDPPSAGPATHHDYRPADDPSPRTTTPPTQDAEPAKAQPAPAAREPKVRNARPRPWDDKPAKQAASPDRTGPTVQTKREPASQKRGKQARSDPRTDAGGTALASKDQARKQKVAAGKAKSSKQPSPKRANDGTSQRRDRAEQPEPADDAEPAGQETEHLTPAEAAIQAAEARKAKRHRKTG